MAQTLIPAAGVCSAAKKWFRYLLKAMKEFEFEDIIVSMSMENLQMPEAWKQRLFNGGSRSNWMGASDFIFSPTNTEVKTYWEKAVRDYMDIVVEEGFTPILQLGSPGGGGRSFSLATLMPLIREGRPAFMTRLQKACTCQRRGKSLPVFTSSEISLNAENLEAIEWLRGKLGDFSNFARSIVKSYIGGKYTVLFFPPSVLDEERVPEAMRMVNYPADYWKLGNLDFIQIEDYDWLVCDNIRHPDVF